MNAAKAKQIEKSLKATVDSNLQKNLCKYLRYYRKVYFYKLIEQANQDYTIEDRNIIIGELRVIQKLLDVLEPKAGMFVFDGEHTDLDEQD